MIGGALSSVKGFQTRSDDLEEEVDKLRAHADRMSELAKSPDLTDAGRSAAQRAADQAAAGAARTSTEAQKALSPIDKIPQPIRKAIAANPGQLIDGSTGIVGTAKTALKGLPYVGTSVSFGWAAWDITHGKPVGRTLAKTGGSLAGAIVAGEAGAKLGGIIGTFIEPGGGTVVGGAIGGVIGGAIGGISGAGLVDSLYGDDK